MTFQEMFQNAKKMLNRATAADVTDHVAVQVNVTGDGSGIFYIEAADGSLSVEPYDYVDNDAVLTADSAALLEALQKAKTDALALEGDLEKIAKFRSILSTIPAPEAEASAKKPVTKKAVAEKPAEKAVEKPAEKPVEKPAATTATKPTTVSATATAKAVTTTSAPKSNAKTTTSNRSSRRSRGNKK